MKKIKAILLLPAIAVSVTASVASLPQPYCFQQTQYFKMTTPWGYYFYPAGRSGVDYYCEYSSWSAMYHTTDRMAMINSFHVSRANSVPICNWQNLIF